MSKSNESPSKAGTTKQEVTPTFNNTQATHFNQYIEDTGETSVEKVKEIQQTGLQKEEPTTVEILFPDSWNTNASIREKIED